MKAFIKNRRKRRAPSALDIPALIIFLTVMTVYALSGNASEDAPGNTRAASASVQNIITTAAPDHTAPVTDAQLTALSTSTVLVTVGDGNIKKIPLELYTARVVASEMPSTFSYEALKAQAVATRTYVEGRRKQYEKGKSKHPGAYVCATTCCQVYRDEASLRDLKSDSWYENDFNIIKNAVAETAGELLFYNGELVQQPLFFSSAGGGRTENSEDVFTGALPYLRSVESLYDAPEKYINKTTTVPLLTVMSKVKEYAASHESSVTIVSADDSDAASSIEVLSHTEGGGAALIRFGSIALPGRQTRSLFSLSSSDIAVTVNNDNVIFTTQGSGHRVGLSQYGADGMADRGYTYTEILSHYYSGTNVKKE